MPCRSGCPSAILGTGLLVDICAATLTVAVITANATANRLMPILLKSALPLVSVVSGDVNFDDGRCWTGASRDEFIIESLRAGERGFRLWDQCDWLLLVVE